MVFDDLFDEKKRGGQKAKDLNVSLGKSRIKEAYRASQKLPQAVLKVSSYGKGLQKVTAHGLYISRNGNEDLEDPEGNVLKNPKELKRRLGEWEADFDKRKNGRDTVHIILSAPKGSEPGKVENSVREFARKRFSENNDYLFAIHTDTAHPHGHLMVKMRGFDGKKLNLGKAELLQMRQSFAEALRENGIAVDATPRLSRGVGQKGKSMAVKKMTERGISPYFKSDDGQRTDIRAATVKEIIRDKIEGKKQSDKPWAKAAKARTALARSEYAEIGSALMKAGEKSNDTEFRVIGRAILKHSRDIPEPLSKREVIEKQMERAIAKPEQKDVVRGGDLER